MAENLNAMAKEIISEANAYQCLASYSSGSGFGEKSKIDVSTENGETVAKNQTPEQALSVMKEYSRSLG